MTTGKEKTLIGLMVVQTHRLREILASLLGRELGQDMIEYALLVALITIPLIIAILATGPYIENSFQDVANSFASA